MFALSLRTRGTDFIRRLFKLLLGWRVRIRDRRHLTELSDHLLDDIGTRRADIEREASRSFWRVER